MRVVVGHHGALPLNFWVEIRVEMRSIEGCSSRCPPPGRKEIARRRAPVAEAGSLVLDPYPGPAQRRAWPIRESIVVALRSLCPDHARDEERSRSSVSWLTVPPVPLRP